MKVERNDQRITVTVPGIGTLVGLLRGERVELLPTGAGVQNFYTEGYAKSADVAARFAKLVDLLRAELGQVSVLVMLGQGRRIGHVGDGPGRAGAGGLKLFGQGLEVAFATRDQEDAIIKYWSEL